MRHIIWNKDLLALFDYGLALQPFAMKDGTFPFEHVRNSFNAFMIMRFSLSAWRHR